MENRQVRHEISQIGLVGIRKRKIGLPKTPILVHKKGLLRINGL